VRAGVAVLAAVVVLGACGGSTRSIEGRLVDFDGDLAEVRSFSIVTESGAGFTFTPAPDATFHGGPLTHLREHLISGEPVVVFYTQNDGAFVAVGVEDF
jgi:hypothetical protein